MTDLTVLNSQLPAHLKAFQAADNADLSGGVSGGYPIISYRGKVWAIKRGDERTIVVDNENEPVRSLKVVIVKSNQYLSKVYYPDGYVEGSNEKPTCYSNDGITPGLDAEERQAAKCAICPHNQWGSKITDNGLKGKACADVRRVAVAPVEDPTDLHLLRVPAGSLRELANYGNALLKRNVPYQAVVTRIGFDPEAAYPKMVFTPDRWLGEDEAAKVIEVMNDPMIDQIIALTGDTVAAEAGADADPLDALGAPPAHVAQVGKAAPVEQAPPKRQARQPKAAATPEMVEQAMAPAKSTGFGGGTPAPKTAPVAPTPEPETNVLVASADQQLDDVLAALDLDD